MGSLESFVGDLSCSRALPRGDARSKPQESSHRLETVRGTEHSQRKVDSTDCFGVSPLAHLAEFSPPFRPESPCRHPPSLGAARRGPACAIFVRSFFSSSKQERRARIINLRDSILFFK